MILWLMRHYAARWRAVAIPVVLAALIVAFPSMAAVTILPLLAVIWRIGRRLDNTFEAGLPLRARDVVFARALVLVSSLALPIVAWVVCAPSQGLFGWPVDQRIAFAAVLLLTVAQSFAFRPHLLPRTPASIQVVQLLCVLGVAAFTWYLVSPIAVAGVAVAGIAATLHYMWKSTPDVFLKALLDMERVRSGRPDGGASSWQRPMFRILFSKTAIVTVVLMFTTGYLGHWFLYVFILGLGMLAHVRSQTAWLTSLPISNRKRLALLLAPVILTIPIPLAAGWLILPHVAGLHRYITLNAPRRDYPSGHYYSYRTNVRLEYWERSRNRETTVISPWGETTSRDTLRILGVQFYNPYSSEEANSQRFIDWQFARATKAMYGRSITLPQEDDTSVPIPSLLTHTFNIAVLAWGATLGCVLLMVLLSEVGLDFRLAQSKIGRILALAIPNVFMFLGLGIDLYFDRGSGAGVIVPLAHYAIMKIAHAFESNRLMLIALAALPAVVLYALLERQSRRSESQDGRRLVVRR